MGDEDNCVETVKADHDFLKGMIDLIPPKFYFKEDHLNEVLAGSSSDEDEEEESGKKSEKSRHKRAKFDPSQVRTVSKIQDLAHRKEHHEEHPLPKRGRKRKASEDAVEVKSSTENLEDLRARIQNKIQTMRVKRRALGKDDYLEKKRLKKKMMDMQRKMKKANQKTHKSGDHKGAPLSNGLGSPKQGPQKTGIKNSDGKLVFSKFDFSEAEKQGKKDKPGRKNFKKLLEKVNQDKEKLAALKETDKDKAKKLQEKKSWQNALQRAEGVKVKDDPTLLNKSIKKVEQKKRKTQKEWKERDEKVEKKMQDRQDKRKKNIQSKKQSRIDKKIKKAKKKGRIGGF